MSPKKKKSESQAIREPEFGRRLKAVRRQLKLKQEEMAEKLNISMSTLSEIETGKSYPGYDFFYNMVAHFKVNLYYLLFGTGEMLGLPGTGSADKKEKNENEMTLIADSKDTREFLNYFNRSLFVRYRVVGDFYNFLHKYRKDIEAEIASHKKEKSGPGKE